MPISSACVAVDVYGGQEQGLVLEVLSSVGASSRSPWPIRLGCMVASSYAKSAELALMNRCDAPRSHTCCNAGSSKFALAVLQMRGVEASPADGDALLKHASQLGVRADLALRQEAAATKVKMEWGNQKEPFALEAASRALRPIIGAHQMHEVGLVSCASTSRCFLALLVCFVHAVAIAHCNHQRACCTACLICRLAEQCFNYHSHQQLFQGHPLLCHLLQPPTSNHEPLRGLARCTDHRRGWRGIGRAGDQEPLQLPL